MWKVKNVCVFCGARSNVPQEYKDIAAEFGKILVRSEKHLVYGGSGTKGMMGILSHSVATAGGYVTGIFPERILGEFEVISEYNTENIIVNSLHERKKEMVKRSDAFVVLPGGYGTLDEFFEVLVLKQLGIHDKPVFILNTYGFWDPLLEMLGKIGDMHFCLERHRDLYVVMSEMEDIFRHEEMM